MISKDEDNKLLTNVPIDTEISASLRFIGQMSEEDLDKIFNEVFKNCVIRDIKLSKQIKN